MLNNDAASLEKISALSELHNSIEDAAKVLQVTADELTTFIRETPAARDRWERGGIEATNQLKICLTRQALAGSVQAAKLLLEMRADCPAAAGVPSSPPARPGAAWRMMKIPLAALEIGVSAQLIRNAIHDETHALPYKVIAGEWHVQPGACFDWISQHARRRPPNLREPAGYAPEKPAPASAPTIPTIGTAGAALIEITDDAILSQVVTDTSISNDFKKVLLAWVDTRRRKAESEDKRAARLDMEDALKMLRALGETYAEIQENSAPARAMDLVRFIRDEIGVDLHKHNTSATQLLTAALCDADNRITIPALKQRVKDECEGVKMLAGVA